MRKIYIILIVILPLFSMAQKQGNVWYFGRFAGLDFNTGTPIPIVSSEMKTNEGSASIADKNTGELLFYTNGINIYDRNNNIMPNGFGLGGDSSTTQSALIIPKPGSNSLYYVFTVDVQAGIYGFNSGGLNYSIVDMTLNGGLGDVTTLDKLLVTPTTEKLCGIFACNGTDIWAVTHLWNSDAFYAYLITKNGISAPVISHSGITHTDVGSFDNAETIGYMKFSPNGKKLALACYSELNTVQIFDFDNSTGKISNPATDVNYPEYTFEDGPYGVSFSPDNTKLYVSYSEYLTPSSSIYQYNLMAGDSNAIIASRINIDSIPFYQIGALQNGPDGKMYVTQIPYLASTGGDSLDVIDNPNGLGASCNFIFNALYLGGAGYNQCVFGLPNMIENYLPQVDTSSIEVEPQSPSFCFGSGVKLTASGGTTYTWSPSTGLSATSGSTVIANPSATTTYSITSNSSGCSSSATDVVTIFPGITFSAAGNGTTISFTSDSAVGGVTAYTWDFGDTTDVSHDANAVHTYKAVRTYYVCLTVYNNSNCSYTRCEYVDLTKTGVQTISGQPDFQLYPNPTSGKLLVNGYFAAANPSSGGQLLGHCSFEITNVLGQTLISQTVQPDSKQTIIDVSSLSAGVYLLELKTNEGIAVKKIVKE